MGWLRPFIASTLLLASMSPNLPLVASRGIPHAWAEVASGATLTILADPVEVAAAGTTTFEPAQDGQAVWEGAVVRTGPSGLALLTFFEGSETQLASDTQVQIDQAHSEPQRRVVLFQAAGVTVSRVERLSSGQVFETDTPAATAMVRGTTYVVAVNRLHSPASTPGASSAPPAPSDPPASDANEAEHSSPDVRGAAQHEDGGAFLPAGSGKDSPDGATPATFEDPGLVEQVAAGVGSALPLNATQASGPRSPVCARDDANACVSSIVLLADPSGHVGRVDVAPRAQVPTISLVAAGAVGIAAGEAAVESSLTQRALAQLQASTEDLGDPVASRQTQHESEQMTREGAAWVDPDGVPLPATPRLTGPKDAAETATGVAATIEPALTAPAAIDPGSQDPTQQDKEQSAVDAEPEAARQSPTTQAPHLAREDATAPAAALQDGSNPNIEAIQPSPDVTRDAETLEPIDQPPVGNPQPGANPLDGKLAQDRAKPSHDVRTSGAAPEESSASKIEAKPAAPNKPNKDVDKPKPGYSPPANNGPVGNVPPGAGASHGDLPPDGGTPPDAPRAPEPPSPPNTPAPVDVGKPAEGNLPKPSDTPQQVDRPQADKADGAGLTPSVSAGVGGVDTPAPTDKVPVVAQVPTGQATDAPPADQKASGTAPAEQKAAKVNEPGKLENPQAPLNPPATMPRETSNPQDTSTAPASAKPQAVPGPTDGNKPAGAASIARDKATTLKP